MGIPEILLEILPLIALGILPENSLELLVEKYLVSIPMNADFSRDSCAKILSKIRLEIAPRVSLEITLGISLFIQELSED